MRALRLVEAMRLELVDLPEIEPDADEVVVRVAACGICGSDLSCYKTGVFAPVVLGHEFSGIVESTGDRVDPSLTGLAVVVDPKVPCGRCEDCAARAPNRGVSSLTLGLRGGR